MLYEDVQIQSVLWRMTARLTSDHHLRQDLMQDGLVHLWKIELHHPGNTTSWYLQSCEFHLRNVLRHGRSLDSPRRKGHFGISLSILSSILEDLIQFRYEECIVSEVHQAEIIRELSSQLSALDLAILKRLINGESTREIGRRLGRSAMAISKSRKRIRETVEQTGLEIGASQ